MYVDLAHYFQVSVANLAAFLIGTGVVTTALWSRELFHAISNLGGRAAARASSKRTPTVEDMGARVNFPGWPNARNPAFPPHTLVSALNFQARLGARPCGYNFAIRAYWLRLT